MHLVDFVGALVAAAAVVVAEEAMVVEDPTVEPSKREREGKGMIFRTDRVLLDRLCVPWLPSMVE